MKQSKRQQLEITDRPAPNISGLYGVQSISGSKEVPDVTVYRAHADMAEDWLGRMISFSQHNHHAMNYGPDKWDVYDMRGELVAPANKICKDRISAVADYPDINRDQLIDDAMMTLKLPGKLVEVATAAQSHKETIARAVNIMIALRRFLLDASEEDLQHFYLVDSRRYPGRVTSLLADVQFLSPSAQDKYLDYTRAFSLGECVNDSTVKHVVSNMLTEYVTEHQFSAGLSLWGHTIKCMVDMRPTEAKTLDILMQETSKSRVVSQAFWASLCEMFSHIHEAVDLSKPMLLADCLQMDVYEKIIKENRVKKLDEMHHTKLLFDAAFLTTSG